MDQDLKMKIISINNRQECTLKFSKSIDILGLENRLKDAI